MSVPDAIQAVVAPNVRLMWSSNNNNNNNIYIYIYIYIYTHIIWRKTKVVLVKVVS